MRSLWRVLALQWLGEGSDALAGDSTVLEAMLFGEHARAMHAFDVQREHGVSHQALTLPATERRVEIAAEEIWCWGSQSRDIR